MTDKMVEATGITIGRNPLEIKKGSSDSDHGCDGAGIYWLNGL